MGVTTAELGKMTEQGQLTAEDLLPKLSIELMKMANAGGQLAEAMNNTNSAMNRFKTNVFLANATFNQSGFDKAVRNFFNTSSDAIARAEPLWKLMGQASMFLSQALEAPIELFGTLAESLGYFTDESGKANEQAKLIGAALLLVSKRARTLFAIFWLIPAALSGINNMIQNGLEDWKDLALVIGTVAASALLLRNRLSGVSKLLGGMKGGLGGVNDAANGGKNKPSKGGIGAGLTGAMFLPQMKEIGNAGNQFLNENIPFFKETNDFMSEYNPAYRYFRESFGQGNQAATTNNNLNGDITIEINGAQDSNAIRQDVLDTVNGLFRTASGSNPITEK